MAAGGLLDRLRAEREVNRAAWARVTGAGFGGCGIALVKQSGFDKFTKEMTEFYTAKIGYAPSVYSSTISKPRN